MLKIFKQPSHAKLTKHQEEMATLRAHHASVMASPSKREAALVGAGVFVNNSDGKLVVAKRYEKVISPKRTT